MTFKKCPHCGTELPTDAAFCPACFHRLIEVQSAADVQVHKKNIFLRLISLWLVSAVGVILLIAFFVTSSPKETTPIRDTSSSKKASDVLKKHETHQRENGKDVTKNGDILNPEDIHTVPDGSTVADTSVFSSSKSKRKASTTNRKTKKSSTAFTTLNSYNSAPITAAKNSQSKISQTEKRTVASSKTSHYATTTKTTSSTAKKTTSKKPAWYEREETNKALFNYEITEDGIEIIKYLGADDIVIVPKKIENRPVVSIRFMAFSENKYIKKVFLPDSVTQVGHEAFIQCTSLEELILPGKLKKINFRLVAECESLKSITIPESVEVIENDPFRGTNITHIKIPANVNSILSSFSYTSKSLEYIEVDKNNTTFYDEDGILFEKTSNGLTLHRYPPAKKGKKYVIPDKVTDTANCAFQGNVYLEDVTLSPSIKTLRSAVFQNCSSLENVKTYPGMLLIGYSAFESCSSLKELTIYAACNSIISDAFDGCSITLIVEKDSYAHSFAEKYNIPYKTF